MVDRYWRKIEDVENDIENAMQISSILLKLKGYDDDLEKIDTNENNISSNLSKIEDNETNISTNLSNIEDNLEKIDDIKSSLPTSEIFKKTYSIKNQSFRFTRNIVYFKLLEIEIENNFNKDGKLEFDNYIYYKYKNLQLDHHRLQHEYRILDDKNNLLYKKILNKTNTSDLDFDKNIMLVKDNFYFTFKNNYNKIKIILDLYRVYRHGTGNFNLELINESFIKVSYLDKNDISLKIENNENNISSNLSKISDNENNISSNLSKINNNENNISSNLSKINNNENNISSNLSKISDNENNISSNLSKINNNENNISSNLSKINNNKNNISSNLSKINNNENNISTNLININTNENNISSNLSKINNNENNISSNLSKINNNENNISTNLININTNEDNIAYNLNEINYLKNNKPIQYLKNVYNILIYDKETKIDFKKNIFYEKIFDVDASKNDFIEINFKIKLEYNNTDYRDYVKSLYELLDENNNSLYIKSVNNNQYNYFSNKCIIDENIFYNFTNSIKKLKFVIKFQKLSESRIIYVYYKKDNNYRLVIKNYGV